MKKIFWEIISFLGTIIGGCLIVILAFYINTAFGTVVLADFIIITFLANPYKYYRFKPRPDCESGRRPEKPFELADVLNFLSPGNCVQFFQYIDAASMPSIHSARVFNQAVLFAAFLGGAVPLFALAVLAVLVAVSRVVKRRHFPSDVAVGAVLGLLVAALSTPFI